MNNIIHKFGSDRRLIEILINGTKFFLTFGHMTLIPRFAPALRGGLMCVLEVEMESTVKGMGNTCS